MNHLQNVRRRLRALERLPQFQPSLFQYPASPKDPIWSAVIKQMSDDDLELTIKLSRDWNAGVYQPLSPGESQALERVAAALDTEAQRLGFESHADAQRRVDAQHTKESRRG